MTSPHKLTGNQLFRRGTALGLGLVFALSMLSFHPAYATIIPAVPIGPSAPLATDRARIRVVDIADAETPDKRLKVLRSDANTPIRAGTAWVWSQEPAEQPASYYKSMREAGLNAVRIILFDVWIHEEGYGKYDWSEAAYQRSMIEQLERAVNHCSENGLYAIINAHNRVPASGVPKYDEALNTGLWKVVAPHFAQRSHVLYELSNEPISGPGRDGQVDPPAQTTLAALARVHNIARSLAPDTHLMILTPAGISGYGTKTAMSNLTRNFEKLTGPIDWTKTSVAYHLYHADTNLFPRAENLRQFHQDFPGWPSENNFPPGFPSEKIGAKPGDNERSARFGSDEFTLQTCEIFGLGWSQWHIEGPKALANNWAILWADAVAKGYAWEHDDIDLQIQRPGL